VLLWRAPPDVPPTAPADARRPPPVVRTAAGADPDVAAEPRETPADAQQRELEAMSETFRNTTFLIAIRDAGFACNELLRVYGGLDDSAKWTATCSEMLSYTVGVATNGTLHVEPMLQYFDGLGRQPIQQFNDPALPPQPLPQPR
jgi:hypothetical protein